MSAEECKHPEKEGKYLCYHGTSPEILYYKKWGNRYVWSDGDHHFIEPDHFCEIPPHDWEKQNAELKEKAERYDKVLEVCQKYIQPDHSSYDGFTEVIGIVDYPIECKLRDDAKKEATEAKAKTNSGEGL